jgi:hypothetical protein
VRRFDIPAGPLARTLPAFARQSGQQILYPSALVADRASASLSGDYSVETALALLLRDTGLTYRRSRPNVFVLIDPSQRAEAEQLEAVQLDEVVVTGSLLRGVLDGPSPVVVVSRDQIDRDGHATVAQALAALPQNFAGTANDATLSNGGDRSCTNANYSNGVNLRGLGSDATLVLVNGRRIAGTGSKGDFADVSSIPTAAVERIDVLLDGASALYGADAVGGVVNIILKSRFDGAESRLRVGGTSDGGAEEVLLSHSGGFNWASGGIVAAYEFHDRGELRAADRRATADAAHDQNVAAAHVRHRALRHLDERREGRLLVAEQIEVRVLLQHAVHLDEELVEARVGEDREPVVARRLAVGQPRRRADRAVLPRGVRSGLDPRPRCSGICVPDSSSTISSGGGGGARWAPLSGGARVVQPGLRLLPAERPLGGLRRLRWRCRTCDCRSRGDGAGGQRRCRKARGWRQRLAAALRSHSLGPGREIPAHKRRHGF